MALLLHHRKTKLKTFTITNPSLLSRLFSTTSDGGDKPPSNSPFASYFKDIKETLKQQKTSTPHPSPPPPPPPPRNYNPTPSSLEEIRRNLSEFRRRAVAPPPPPPPSADSISFQELYHKNISQKLDESSSSSPSKGYGNAGLATANSGGGKHSLEALRDSLRKMKAGDGKDQMSLPGYKHMLKMRPDSASPPKVFGGTGQLPASISRDKGKGDGSSAEAMRTKFVRLHRPEELGAKLRKLRPESKENDWFSIKELRERLMRLREMEEKESQYNIKEYGVAFSELKETLIQLEDAKKEKEKKSSSQYEIIF